MFCERCGIKLDRAAAARAQFCAGCATFVGEECWAPGRACITCVETGHAGAAVGLVAVRRAERQLGITRREVDGLEAIARLSDGEPPQLAHEAWFARQRVHLIGEAARRAASRTAARYASRLAPLESAITAQRDEIVARLDALEAGRPRQRRLRTSFIPAVGSVPPGIVPAAGVALLVVLLAAVLIGLWRVPAGRAVGDLPRTPEAGVAAARGTPDGAAEPGSPSARPSTSITFDGFRIGMGMGDGISIVRGSERQVRVSPRPTAVDRSLALVADAGGEGPEVCIDSPFAVESLELELLMSEGMATVAVTMGDPDAPATRLILDGGRLELNGVSAPAAIEPDRWYRVTVQRDRGRGTATAFVGDPESRVPAEFSAHSLTTRAAGDASRVCVALADADPGVELLINNVEVWQ